MPFSRCCCSWLVEPERFTFPRSAATGFLAAVALLLGILAAITIPPAHTGADVTAFILLVLDMALVQLTTYYLARYPTSVSSEQQVDTVRRAITRTLCVLAFLDWVGTGLAITYGSDKEGFLMIPRDRFLYHVLRAHVISFIVFFSLSVLMLLFLLGMLVAALVKKTYEIIRGRNSNEVTSEINESTEDFV